ncbi:hypothetical protein [Defluviimonas salinarum]|uniref:Uncharacterized protein n=1 Tax=Defluviimonas salinarum TaxID=2992147 RepID=A0ABT3J4M9_9RHOB|nr:hypothetical protein [Defluviimonas salinarum]MCW3782626.1 hypothetical protein [Defluviimonas salinarum]
MEVTMFAMGYATAACQILHQPDLGPETEMELEDRLFRAEAKRMAAMTRKSARERMSEAAVALVPASVRKAWAEKALEREFVANCRRLKELSPHLLDDIGVEEVIEEPQASLTEHVATSVNLRVAGVKEKIGQFSSRINEHPVLAQKA